MRRAAAALAALLAVVVALAVTVVATRSQRSPGPSRTASLQSLLDSAGTDLPFDPQLAATSCPYERGPVKEGSDSTRFKVSTTVVATSISYLRGRTKPTTYPRTRRVGGPEYHTYRVHAFLTQYKIQPDGDIHFVIKDSSGRSMIAEIPLGSCVPTTSRWKSAIASTRSRFTHTLHTTTSWHYLHKAIVVKGIGFFDQVHGQNGVAPNGIELHPVIAVSFPEPLSVR